MISHNFIFQRIKLGMKGSLHKLINTATQQIAERYKNNNFFNRLEIFWERNNLV